MQITIADDHPEVLIGIRADEIRFERLQESGAMLDCCYALFERIFPRTVLDPKEVYMERMSPMAAGSRDFLPCYMIAYIDRGDHRLVAGFLSADVMWLSEPADGAILAIGNIGTSPALKDRGLKGVGTELLEATISIARREVVADGRRLLCVATEAEPASLGFWKKRGFLKPQGCNYLQPPLEWDDAGNPVHKEVPETLLLAPVDMPEDKVEAATVRGVILAIYENWCLRVWRGVLPAAALLKADEYVMGRVLGEVMSTMPTEPMALSNSF
jgi:ribosomal protein S18 acetylase RimI-like enzyme